MEDCQKQDPLMKNLFSALFLICLALSCGVCEAKYSPKRMGNQIYVSSPQSDETNGAGFINTRYKNMPHP